MLARVKVGDLVEIISGKDKKKRGAILEISKDKSKVVVRGIALATKFQKSKNPGEKGVLIKKEAFIHACKVMPICPKEDRPCRVRVSVAADNKKVRVSAFSGLKI
jgi:large subunit ribosomal protein L24